MNLATINDSGQKILRNLVKNVLFDSGSVDSADFMARISEQTRMIQEGMKTLRGEMDNQMRMLDIGQEAVVLSGMNKHAANSLKNIKNLYDETKYLKSYLEKVRQHILTCTLRSVWEYECQV